MTQFPHRWPLTANHAHAAMMGAYGMLACGYAVFALRCIVPPEKWSDRLVKVSFWSLNLGSAWMAVITLLPLGILQLYHSVDVGYWDARSLAFVTSDPNTMLEWLRLPGDVAFIGGGVLPLLWLSLQGVLAVVRGRSVEGSEHDEDLQLFTEVEGHEPLEATAADALADSR